MSNRFIQCNICRSPSNEIFEAEVLARYRVKYFYCPACGFLQTEYPHWLDEAYQDAINAYDTGIMARNLQLSRTVSVFLYLLFDRNGKFLDYAGGYGLFTRRMRDIGFDFYWLDRYAQNLLARGFEYTDDIGDIELITTFESFEHFVRPLEEIESMLSISRHILFTTVPVPSPVPGPEGWWFYAPEHGQHISFYSVRTLAFIADTFHLQYYSFGCLHFFTDRPLNRRILRIVNRLYKLRLDRYIEPLLFSYVRKRLTSRTIDDMNLLISRGNQRG